MAGKVLIFDTSMLCAWLSVPGKDTCGPIGDQWDKKRVDEKLQQEQKLNTTFVLPLAAIIETGNHIAQAPTNRRYELAQEFAALMTKAANEESPWAAFVDQSKLWTAENLMQLAQEWIPLAAQKISLGDVAIKTVAEFYHKLGSPVEILTGDKGLKAYEPIAPTPRKRRSSK